jgi:uncharacterized protein (TIGR00159 family)
MDVIFGLLTFLLLYALSIWFNFPVLEQLLFYFVNVAIIALLIIFQPELRLALSRFSMKGKKYHDSSQFDPFLESLTQCVYELSSKRIGALIVLENQDSLEDLIEKAIPLYAKFSKELLETIFINGTPLHDGAVIIRETLIVSAATILPLANETEPLTKIQGTRHRAALGMSQTSDALIVVISEETGRVSIAREGIITQGIRDDRFKGIIRSVFHPKKLSPSSWKKSFPFKHLLARVSL